MLVDIQRCSVYCISVSVTYTVCNTHHTKGTLPEILLLIFPNPVLWELQRTLSASIWESYRRIFLISYIEFCEGQAHCLPRGAERNTMLQVNCIILEQLRSASAQSTVQNYVWHDANLAYTWGSDLFWSANEYMTLSHHSLHIFAAHGQSCSTLLPAHHEPLQIIAAQQAGTGMW